jgi:hypothetical protein
VTSSYSDPFTGWSFDSQTDASGNNPPEGGMVLQNIRHRSNNFARDMRLVGIRMVVAEVEPPNTVLSRTDYLVTLGAAQFTVGPIQELKPSPAAAPPVSGAGGTFMERLKAAADQLVMLKGYFKESSGNYSGFGLRADYASNAALFASWPNCEVSALNVSQIFLFSTYGKSPPHEPGTVLMAARCHPLTSYAMVANSAVDRTRNFQRIETIRFDYRLHLTIDSVAASGYVQAPTKSNNAGLFRDNDTVNVLSAAGGLLSGGRPASYSKAAFAAVEKPLVLEVTAPGVAEGLSAYKDSTGTHWCWDNVHWWGNRGTGPMISTPGAFHAAHMHWRWGAAGSWLRRSIPVIDTTGRPSGLSGVAISGSADGTLLVDPRVWIQTIRVAVVENDPTLDPNQPGVALANLSKPEWKTLFTGMRATPREISAGADIVCWYSAEVHRELRTSSSRYVNKPEGTVFVHGMFFAHEPEITGFGIGDTGAQNWPRSASAIRSAGQWFRDAS